MKRRFFATAFAALLVLGISSPTHAGPRPGARLLVDCNVTATGMTVTVQAKTKGGGKPQPISEAAPIFIVVDQKVGRNYIGLRTSSTFKLTALPATAKFEFCTDTGSIISPDATALRGRGSLFVTDVGFIGGTCSPSKVPSC